MCSHRLAVAKLVRDYKEPLFSHSPQISRQNKQELWEFIRQQAIAQGAVQYMRKSWKEIRDCVWAPIRRDTMAKVNKAKLVGEDTVLYTEIDKIVLEIIGTNGTGGLDETKGGGVDYFNDENMQAGYSDGQRPQSLDAYNDSGPMSNSSGMEHLLGPQHPTNGGINVVNIGGSGSTATMAEGTTNHVVDIKPGTSLSQMLEMFRDPSQQNVGQNQPQVDVWQQMDEIVAEQHHEQRLNGSKNVATPPIMSPSQNNTNLQQQQNALKRKASSQQIIPNKYVSSSSNTFGTTQNSADAELDRAIKQAKLEQMQLENQLIQEQIEEKHLQNQLLKIEIAQRKAALTAAKK